MIRAYTSIFLDKTAFVDMKLYLRWSQTDDKARNRQIGLVMRRYLEKLNNLYERLNCATGTAVSFCKSLCLRKRNVSRANRFTVFVMHTSEYLTSFLGWLRLNQALHTVSPTFNHHGRYACGDSQLSMPMSIEQYVVSHVRNNVY